MSAKTVDRVDTGNFKFFQRQKKCLKNAFLEKVKKARSTRSTYIREYIRFKKKYIRYNTINEYRRDKVDRAGQFSFSVHLSPMSTFLLYSNICDLIGHGPSWT